MYDATQSLIDQIGDLLPVEPEEPKELFEPAPVEMTSNYSTCAIAAAGVALAIGAGAIVLKKTKSDKDDRYENLL